MMNLQDSILNLLDKHGECSRDYIVMILEYPRTTIYDALAKLKKQHRVSKSFKDNGKRGRPITMWKLRNYWQKEENI